MRHPTGPDNFVGLAGSFVPYHHARWQAFAERCKTPCVIVELTNKDEFSILEFSVQENSAYTRATLFPQNDASSLLAADIRSRTARELDRLRPSCVLLNGYASPMALSALQWCQLNGVHAVMMSESTAWDEPRKGWKEWLKSRVIRLCSSALVGGIPHADYMAQLGMAREKIFTGYDVVDNQHYELGVQALAGREDEIRKELDLPQRYFVACARFTPKKNLPQLVEAYAHYRKLCAAGTTPWDLVILGDGPGRDALLELRSKLGVEGSLHFPGAKPYDKLPAYYGLASAFVHASTTEQWGLVVNEAMSCGLPVLVSNRCGCARDLISEGVNGFTFDPYQVEDIAQKMFQLATLNDKLPGFGRASSEIVAKWSPERFATGLSQAIAAALASPVPKSTWFDRVLIKLLIHR